jgi:crotonobetainyl-CoA:carnitine CoA-transferase CaiB-like acyl-CoA transferase
MAPGPLAGVLVADFSRVLAGPYATMLLGDLGATVVKVERTGHGDDTRAWGPPWSSGMSTYFQAVNRNKHSVHCDLSNPDDLRSARQLCERADVLVENFRTGTLARFGLGPTDLLLANRRLVYCSITGFGPTADLPGYDALVQAVGGLMSITGEPGQPAKVGVAVVDVITGLHALAGILAALRHRDLTGTGQLVEVDLLSSLLSGLVNQVSGYLNAGTVPAAQGNAHPSIVPYGLFRAEDRPLVLAVGNDQQFAALVAELGRPELATDPRFAVNASRVAHRTELVALLEERLAGAGAGVWVDRLTARGVPCGLVNRVDEAVDLAVHCGLDPVVELAGSRQIRHPVRFGATPPSYRYPPAAWSQVRSIRDLPTVPVEPAPDPDATPD